MTTQKRNSSIEGQFAALEARLAVTLKPVHPPAESIQRLRARIRLPDREEIARRLGDWRRLFFVFSGVMSGMLLLITLARALYYFTGRKV